MPFIAVLLLWATPASDHLTPTVGTFDNQDVVCERLLALAAEDPRLELRRSEHQRSKSSFVQGFFTVPENRATGEGRTIRLGFVVLPARAAEPAPDPVFILHGGPGAAATAFFPRQVNGWIRETRDVVLIDQRGTGSSNRLDVPMPGSDDDLQSYFENYFDRERFEAALPALREKADLTQYTTANSVDDFDELRRALGYGKINLRGGSYGTRSALVYMRRHGETIRSASIQGVQPISYRNPLPHARSAQEALDQVFEEIRSTPKYAAAFPDLEDKFEETLRRLAEAPAEVTLRHPVTGEPTKILLDRNGFAEGVRLQLYTLPGNRGLPLLLTKAYEGDYTAFAEASMTMSRSLRGVIAWGMLMCVTTSEDICRIDPDEVEAACAGTFLGTTRVVSQMEVAAIWPVEPVPESFAEPVAVEVPVLLLSGSHDPSTSAKWGARAAKHLPNGLHIVLPGGHGVAGPEVERLERAFLEQGTIEGLDLSEVEALELPPLVLPGRTR